jgi:hypothetical protein
MNLLTAAASAANWVGTKAKEAVKKVSEIAQQQLSGELGRVKDSVTLVRNAVTDASNKARDAAADAIAKSAAGVGIQVASRVGTEGNVYQRASAFLDLSPEKRNLLMWGAIALAAVAIFYVARKTS